MKRKALTGIFAIAVFLVAQTAYAQAEGGMASRSGRWNMGGGLGFTVDPDLVGAQLGVDYYITNDISVGPLLIGAMSGNDKLWGLSGQVKYSARLADNDIVRPYGHLGIGFVNLDLDRYNDGNATTKYLFPVGGGFEFELNDELTLDVNALFIVSEVTSVGLFLGMKYLF